MPVLREVRLFEFRTLTWTYKVDGLWTSTPGLMFKTLLPAWASLLDAPRTAAARVIERGDDGAARNVCWTGAG